MLLTLYLLPSICWHPLCPTSLPLPQTTSSKMIFLLHNSWFCHHSSLTLFASSISPPLQLKPVYCLLQGYSQKSSFSPPHHLSFLSALPKIRLISTTIFLSFLHMICCLSWLLKNYPYPSLQHSFKTCFFCCLIRQLIKDGLNWHL